VVEVEDNSNSSRGVTRFSQGETVHRRCLCLCSGPLGRRQESRLHPGSKRQKTYLCNIAIWVGSRIPVNFYNHSLHELREFREGQPVFWALARKLRHFQKRITTKFFREHTSKTLPSTFSCHAGIPWPVSKLWVGSPDSGCCQT
jgi:hypothetical protein